MIKLPLNSKWSQPNTSDKFGSLAYARNINLDQEGYLKLSPRSVNIFDDTANTANIADNDFDYPVAFGRYDTGQMYIATTDEPFNLTLSASAKTIAEDAGANNPNLNFQSHGVWWQKRFYESTDTAVNYNTAGTWTANAITGLTSGVRHYMCVFKNRNNIVVSNGNVLKQYDTSHVSTIDLTVPSDFEITGVAYNNEKVGIITRLGTDTAGENAEAFFFIWDGATTAYNLGVAVGAYACVAVRAYKSSFIVLTNTGRLLYWNGGGFDELATLPIYAMGQEWGDLLNHFGYGDNMAVDGDVVYINLGFNLQNRGRLQEKQLQSNPAGVWCFDPKVGLYHRYSPSVSKMYLHSISQANVDTGTDILTTTATIPATGNPLIMSSQTLGGLKQGVVYYVIKLSATTFQVAETKALALAGVALNITSADTNNYLFLYDLVDYGQTHYNNAGAVGLWGTSTTIYTDVIFGGAYYNTSLAFQKTLCTAAPFLENRGYAVFPKMFADSVSENIQSVSVKHKPLNVNDAIIIKAKNKDILGLPLSSVSAYPFNWTSDNEGNTSLDLSDAQTAFDANEELEIEFTAGVGAGQCVKITNMSNSGGVYALVLEDNVVGAAAGLKSHFILDNWKTCATADYSTQKEGVFEASVAEAGKSVQIKAELRGYDTTIEDILIVNNEQIN